MELNRKMGGALRSRRIQLVVKVTKHCNLRCSYCYEFPCLADRHVMPLTKISALIDHVAAYKFDVETPLAGDDGYEFIWHGGEPFMVPIEHYESIRELQRKKLGPLAYTNVTQTNLTILTERHLDWLKRETVIRRGGLGFSFDVYGDRRRDIRGRQTTQKVLKNLKLLIDNDIPAGAIAVLSRSTVGHVQNIFNFYNGLGIDFRLLPYHLEAEGWRDEHFTILGRIGMAGDAHTG